VQERGYGLTHPQVLQDLWQRYEQLQRESLARTGTVSPSAPPPALAWQRTDRYVPPDPNGFFPDDPEGGRKLDALFRAGDREQRATEEILATVRQGLRTAQNRQ